MRDKLRKTSTIIVITWIVLTMCGLILISAYREHRFNEQLEGNINDLEHEIDDRSLHLNTEQAIFYTGDPEQISDFFQSQLYTIYYSYLLDVNKYFRNIEKGNIIGGTVSIQGYEYSLFDLHRILVISYSDSTDAWKCHSSRTKGDKTYCSMLSSYLVKNGDWKGFTQSENYSQFVNDFFVALENKNGSTLQEVYHYVINQEDTNISVDFHSDTLLDSHQYLVQRSYENYLMHKEQNDFIHAQMDSEIIYTLYKTYKSGETIGMYDFITILPISTGFVTIHNVFHDVFTILFISSAICVIIFLLNKKYVKKNNN